MVIDGEVLRFKAAAKPGNGIQIRETTENIVADGTTYREARIYRYAEYVPTYTKNVPGLYPASGFSMIETNDQLAKKLLDYTAVNSDLAKKLTVLSTDSLTHVGCIRTLLQLLYAAVRAVIGDGQIVKSDCLPACVCGF